MPTQPLDWQRPETLYTAVCRPALPRDTSDVMELTRTIWEGNDYVPSMWAQWLADPEGMLAVAEYGSRVVGLCKLSRLGPGEWWLQGLRVHPEYEKRGIASRLHDYMLSAWLRTGSGVIRLATASFREPVQHLCERTDFKKVGEFTPYVAPGTSLEARGFSPLSEKEADKAYAWATRNSSYRLTGGLMEIGWEWVTISKYRIGEAANNGRAWWWSKGRGTGRGLLVARDEADEDALVIQLLACSERDLAACLLDFRGLALSLGFSKATWFPPLGTGLEPVLEDAGFQREWDASVYVYEKKHPVRP